MNTIASTSRTTLSTTLRAAVTVVAVSVLLAPVARADAQDGRPSEPDCSLSQQEVANWGETSTHLMQACDDDGPDQGYTTLDHPSLPCRLSKKDVANWGETSAHLPLACSYGEKR